MFSESSNTFCAKLCRSQKGIKIFGICCSTCISRAMMLVMLIILNLFGRALPQDTTCNGVPSTNWSCCDPEHPCIAGGCDCDRDSDCVGSFKCGNNNCRDDYSVDGSNWSVSADCCYGKIQR